MLNKDKEESMKQTKDIFKQALELPPTKRVNLIEQLYSSFGSQKEEEVNKKWAEEAESRIDAYEEGEIKATDADEVFERINSKQVNES